jgi:hypothetical protein
LIEGAKMAQDKSAKKQVDQTPHAPNLDASLATSVAAKLLDAAKAGRGDQVATIPEIHVEASEARTSEFFSEAHRLDAAKARQGDQVAEIPEF